MTEMYQQYGHWNDDGMNLAAWIWGHRLRTGQHWMEYMLEFLNVLAGYDYTLGCGINQGEKGNESEARYKVFTRLGLRRFVFYDDKEKTPHPYDDRALQLLVSRLEESTTIKTVGSDTGPLDLSKALLRSLSAVEEQRSWYAKFLLPVHHNLLYWEAIRRGATKYETRGSIKEDIDADELDYKVDFDRRNFFARGGELYYLIVSAGTREDMDCRQSIAKKLKHLLYHNNRAIGALADIIDRTWIQMSDHTSDNGKEKRFQLGWIPITQAAHKFYRMISEDLNTFLHANLDPLEKLDLLAHLISFHLTLYIYFHANVDNSPSPSGTVIPITLLVDALGELGEPAIRRVSELLYQQQEARILHRAQEYVSEKIRSHSSADPYELDMEIRRIFRVQRSRQKPTKARILFDEKYEDLLSRIERQEIDFAQFQDEYVIYLTGLLLDDFKKNFFGVHRKLAKSIVFVAPRKGTNARYVLGENLLKALVLANVQSPKEITYSNFLVRLHERYGLVIGPEEARLSGLHDSHHISIEYYDENRRALLEKMRYGGLAYEYSDATAMVRSQYA